MRRIFVRLIGAALVATGTVLAGCDNTPTAPTKPGAPPASSKPADPGKTKLPVDPG